MQIHHINLYRTTKKVHYFSKMRFKASIWCFYWSPTPETSKCLCHLKVSCCRGLISAASAPCKSFYTLKGLWTKSGQGRAQMKAIYNAIYFKGYFGHIKWYIIMTGTVFKVPILPQMHRIPTCLFYTTCIWRRGLSLALIPSIGYSEWLVLPLQGDSENSKHPIRILAIRKNGPARPVPSVRSL